MEGLSRQAKERLNAWKESRPARYLYDRDGEFISPQERKECKVFAMQIRHYLESNSGWHSVREILDTVGREHLRLFDCAISMLMDSVASKDCGQRTMYQFEQLRRTPWVDLSDTSFLFKRKIQDKRDPVGAMMGERDI